MFVKMKKIALSICFLSIVIVGHEANAATCNTAGLCAAGNNVSSDHGNRCVNANCEPGCFAPGTPFTYEGGSCNAGQGAGSCEVTYRFIIRNNNACNPNPCVSNLSFVYNSCSAGVNQPIGQRIFCG